MIKPTEPEQWMKRETECVWLRNCYCFIWNKLLQLKEAVMFTVSRCGLEWHWMKSYELNFCVLWFLPFTMLKLFCSSHMHGNTTDKIWKNWTFFHFKTLILEAGKL